MGNTNLPEQIFTTEKIEVPDFTIDVCKHEDIGDRVICAYCNVAQMPAKRITQDIYGVPVNKIPVWMINNRIVSNWFALILEEKYQDAVRGKTITILNL